MRSRALPIRRSLTGRLVRSYVALIVGLACVGGFGILQLTRRYFVAAERRSMLVQARVVAASCDDACLSRGANSASINPAELPAAANSTQAQNNTAGNLGVDGGAPIGTTTQQSIRAVLPSTIRIIAAGSRADRRGLLADALRGHEAVSVGDGRVVAAVPIHRGAAIVGAVEASGSLSDANAVVADIRRQVIVSLLGATALAVLAAIWRARSITRPIRALTASAHELSTGNFDIALPPATSRDELGELTAAFERLRGSIHAELMARANFVGDASHELRTPLAAMRGAVEILGSDSADRPEVRRRFATSLRTETDRLLRLVDDLLALNTAEHTSRAAMTEQLDLVSLATSVVSDLAPLAIERRVELKLVVTCDEAPVVSDDRSTLRQLLINIVENAMVHAPDGRSVCITISSTADSYFVDVRDHGLGIAPADRARVFDRFTRLDMARSRHHGGAGLGLAIARSIAVAHGGSIHFVDPPDTGAGVVARISLPRPSNPMP